MRAWLVVCAALALAPGPPPAATAARAHHPPPPRPHPSRARLDHIKTQILAKLGLTARPTPLRAPPRDVVRKILQRAADPAPAQPPEPAMREIIAIAHRDFQQVFQQGLERRNTIKGTYLYTGDRVLRDSEYMKRSTD